MPKPRFHKNLSHLSAIGLKRPLLLLAFALLLLSGWFVYSAYAEQTWTGYGTVLSREKIEASENPAVITPMMGQSVSAGSSASTEETYSLTVRDSKGKDHTFRATKMQYDAAQLGARFYKND